MGQNLCHHEPLIIVPIRRLPITRGTGTLCMHACIYPETGDICVRIHRKRIMYREPATFGFILFFWEGRECLDIKTRVSI